MNQINIHDDQNDRTAWSVVILEPEELNAIACGSPAMIDLDPENECAPMLTLACEEESDRLQEVLAGGDAENILRYLRHEQPKFADTIEGRTRQDYERVLQRQTPQQRMERVKVIPAESVNVAAGSAVGNDTPDRICMSLAITGSDKDVCYEITNMANADKLIALLIAARNRLWPHGRICL